MLNKFLNIGQLFGKSGKYWHRKILTSSYKWGNPLRNYCYGKTPRTYVREAFLLMGDINQLSFTDCKYLQVILLPKTLDKISNKLMCIHKCRLLIPSLSLVWTTFYKSIHSSNLKNRTVFIILSVDTQWFKTTLPPPFVHF